MHLIIMTSQEMNLKLKKYKKKKNLDQSPELIIY